MDIKECKEIYEDYSGDECFIDEIFRKKIDYDLNKFNKTIKEELRIVDIESYEFKERVYNVCEKMNMDLFEDDFSTIKKALRKIIGYDMEELVEDVHDKGLAEVSLEIIEDYTKILRFTWS